MLLPPLPPTVKGQPDREGTLVKKFVWRKDQQTGKAYNITVYVVDKTSGTEKRASATCPVTPAEFAVSKSLVLNSMPAFYGFDLALGNTL